MPARPGMALVGPGGTLPLDRRTVEALAEFFVGMLDIVEPRPDCELDGDEADGNRSEEDFIDFSGYGSGPGCAVADPDIGIESQPEGGDCHGAHC